MQRSRVVGLVTSLVVVFAVALTATGSADAATVSRYSVNHVVAKNPHGKMTSYVSGHTANGRTVTGAFTPLKFSHRNGHERARGLLTMVVHNANGSIRTFSVMRTMRVKSINGTPATARQSASTAARANCGILHLVLAPLDLNLLGLTIHLDRVLLDVTAVSGAGNLLGNLLCSVAGLLDGGLGGLLGQLTQTLNAILRQLGLGL